MIHTMAQKHTFKGYPDQPAILALADGTTFKGLSLGATGTTVGEVVFTTGMTGYQEVITDPSYTGQIVTMTAPQIGNTGVNPHDEEDDRPRLSGFVVRESSPAVSSWRSTGTLPEYLAHHGIVAIEGIDTRALTTHIRDHGSQNGVIATVNDFSDSTINKLVQLAASATPMLGRDLATAASTGEPYTWNKGSGTWATTPPTGGDKHIVAIDFGLKRNILRLLVDHGCRVTVVPSRTSPEEILSLHPDGLFVSNGPGDPGAITYAKDNLRKLITKLPTFGICLGHQLIALALGAGTSKLKFGHRGTNQPVKDLSTGRVEITTQNHGFVVHSLPKELTVSHSHLNDNTIEGLSHSHLPIISVQYHPEASAGPHDSRHLFTRFTSLIEN